MPKPKPKPKPRTAPPPAPAPKPAFVAPPPVAQPPPAPAPVQVKRAATPPGYVVLCDRDRNVIKTVNLDRGDQSAIIFIDGVRWEHVDNDLAGAWRYVQS